MPVAMAAGTWRHQDDVTNHSSNTQTADILPAGVGLVATRAFEINGKAKAD